MRLVLGDQLSDPLAALEEQPFEAVVITECGERRLARALVAFAGWRLCLFKSARTAGSFVRTTGSEAGRRASRS